MQQVDVEQTFGQMTRRTQGLLAVRAVVGVFIELLKNGEHPFAIVEEDLLLHDEHVAEAGFVAVEERLCILLVVGIHAAQDLVATLQIIVMQQGATSHSARGVPCLSMIFSRLPNGVVMTSYCFTTLAMFSSFRPYFFAAAASM